MLIIIIIKPRATDIAFEVDNYPQDSFANRMLTAKTPSCLVVDTTGK